MPKNNEPQADTVESKPVTPEKLPGDVGPQAEAWREFLEEEDDCCGGCHHKPR